MVFYFLVRIVKLYSYPLHLMRKKLYQFRYLFPVKGVNGYMGVEPGMRRGFHIGHDSFETLAPDPIVRFLEPINAYPDNIGINLDWECSISGHSHAEKKLLGFGNDVSDIVLSVSPQERFPSFYDDDPHPPVVKSCQG